ncbi:hypothetical protein V8C42DRAFT_328397 [Trichoderma barbatum]
MVSRWTLVLPSHRIKQVISAAIARRYAFSESLYMFGLWKKQSKPTNTMRYYESKERYSKRVSRRGRDNCLEYRYFEPLEEIDDEGYYSEEPEPEPWALVRRSRRNLGRVQIGVPAPAPPEPPKCPLGFYLPCQPQACQPCQPCQPCLPCVPCPPQTSCCPTYCFGSPLPKCPCKAPDPPADFVLPVVDLSSSPNHDDFGDSFHIKVAAKFDIHDILCALVHDERKQKVMVQWKGGMTQKLELSIDPTSFKENAQALYVKDRRRYKYRREECLITRAGLGRVRI